MIKELFEKALSIYLRDKERYYTDKTRPRTVSGYDSYGIIVSELPNILIKEAKIDKNKYIVEGSINTGNIADIPWICLFDNEITNTAQNGFYIVYLFDSTMNGIYLSLNQGFTQYKNEFGNEVGKAKIRQNANFAKKLLKSVQGFNFNDIDLHALRDLGKGYEEGNICSKFYPVGEVPEDSVLVDDLRNLIGVYRELKGYVGGNILEIPEKLGEEEFQKNIQNGKVKELQSGRIEKKTKKEASRSSNWARDSNIAFTALEHAGHKCENDETHFTFISAKSGLQFVEAHHLIPMEFQDEFDVSIDVPENIISLCPNCHRAFHNSEEAKKKELVLKFYEKRVTSLKSREIVVKPEIILSYYLR